jgi:hypothetical protein
MAWSIEVAAVRRDSLTEAVPSVFTSTGMTLGVEQAASRDRFPDLCAARLGEWVFVVDTGCRLSGAAAFLCKASESTDVYVVRISSYPLALHYHDGRLVSQVRGLAACLRLAPRADADGELCAMDLLTLQTGVLFHQDMGEVGFTLFQATGRPSERKASPSRVTTADS